MCRITVTKHIHHQQQPDDEDEGCWTDGLLRPFTYYARHRTAEQRRRLWAMVGGRADDYETEEQ